jgi:hypothetical protein
MPIPSIKSPGFPLWPLVNLAGHAGQMQTGWTGKLNKKFMQTSFILNLPATSGTQGGGISRANFASHDSRRASLQLFAPDCAYLCLFLRKKDCLFFYGKSQNDF